MTYRKAWQAKPWSQRCVFGLALILSACATHPRVEASTEPQGILAKMRAACGGNAWDGVLGWHETGLAQLPGQPGMPHEIWHDMRTLKTAMITRAWGRVVRHAGFNGSAYWQVTPDGQIDVGRDPAKLRRHRRDAYLSSSGWYFPDRFPAQITLSSRTLVDGAPRHVLRIAPADAEPFDLWVDGATYRVRKIIAGEEYAELSGYQTFGGICSATIGRQGSGNPAEDIVLHVRTIETSKPIPPAIFEPPAKPSD